tara:strand:+ start:140 stop:1726 length:1587 start_codon:yes stop_codon:yes gene_type:complete
MKIDDIEDIGKPKVKKACRSWSGVLVVTLVTGPGKFSCPFNCKYCPNEPGQPRSYLSSEPAVARGNESAFDPVGQFNSRLGLLRKNGHQLDKIEIIVLGGTFSSYPRSYQTEFIRDTFYAANTYSDEIKRDRLSIEEEQTINETARYRIIGVSLETRPDFITKVELMRFRKLGCTRIQIGVQHTDNAILEFVERGHTVEQSIKAIKLMKMNGFKIDIHIMPDLPTTTPEKDKQMIRRIMNSKDFQADYLKLYPCLDVDFTEIRNMKLNGTWKPYAEEDNGEILIEVCLEAKIHSKRWTRFNRIQRDFPEAREDLVGFRSNCIKTNFRQYLQNAAKKKGIKCLCIRCLEVKKQKLGKYKLFIDSYEASGGIEYFIHYSSYDKNILYGFIRLRFNFHDDSTVFFQLQDTALVRELHVYGLIQVVNSNNTGNSTVQHKGMGKQLVNMAETISYFHGYKKIAIISGVGVREYYKKTGYKLEGEGLYMTKELSFKFETTMYYLYLKIIDIIKITWMTCQKILLNIFTKFISKK